MGPGTDNTAAAPYVSLNGELVPAGEAAIPVFDRGFTYGDALVETLKLLDGRPVFFREHYERLVKGMETAGMEPPPEEEELRRHALGLAEANGVSRGRLRLQVTRGQGDPAGSPDPVPGLEPTVLLTAAVFSGYPQRYYEEGMTCSTVAANRGSWAFLKTASLMSTVLARSEAKAGGADEVLFTSAHGMLLEGGYSNIFFRVDGSYLTTPVNEHILPGIIREKVMTLLEKQGTPAVEKGVRLEELAGDGTAVFLTGSLLGFCPVSRIDSLALTPDRETAGEINRALSELEQSSAVDAGGI